MSKRMIDAEELKKALEENEEYNAIEIIEKMQGYTKYYAFIVSRHRHCLSERDEEIHGIVSVLAKSENDAKRKIKERAMVCWRGTMSPREWDWFSIKFVDEQTAKRKVIEQDRWSSSNIRHIRLQYLVRGRKMIVPGR